MSDLTHLKIIGIAEKTVELEIAQIHPDSELNVALQGPALKATALILLVGALERCARYGKSSFYLVQRFPNIGQLVLPTLAEVDALVEDASITATLPSDAWEEGYFNGMGSNDIRQAKHWAQLPKMRLQLIFHDQATIQDLTVGLAADTTLDTWVLEWA